MLNRSVTNPGWSLSLSLSLSVSLSPSLIYGFAEFLFRCSLFYLFILLFTILLQITDIALY